MHTQQETLKILNCSKMTLARYVKSGKLNRTKKGRASYYDEVEVALLVKEVEDGKRKAGVEITEHEKIELPPEVNKEIENLSADTCLNKVGMQYLQDATKSLIDFGLYEECDKQILLAYSLSAQAYNHYFVRAMEVDAVDYAAETGSATVHPFHRVMMDHQKQMVNYSNMLGLNPLARTKFEIVEKEKNSSIMDILND